MKIEKRQVSGFTIFDLEGRLDSTTTPDVESQILETIKLGIKHIILNFSKLDYISSAGIRLLVHCHKEIEKEHGQIFLTCVPKQIENVLYITGFLPYFKVFESEQQALEILSKLTEADA